jgi:hypothetical protein
MQCYRMLPTQRGVQDGESHSWNTSQRIARQVKVAKATEIVVTKLKPLVFLANHVSAIDA